ncbi:MAG: hypothetical protein AB8H80_10325 [Planctomycetota bacterium]
MIRTAAPLSAVLMWVASVCVASLFVGGTHLPAQKKLRGFAKLVQNDPYTDKDPKAMKKLGVISYGPLTWADNLRTPDIEKVIGENRVLWFETEHFKVGCNLGVCTQPKDSVARKRVKAEMKLLNKRSRKIPASKSKLDPWLRAHLFALRAEQLYDEFAELTGHAADDEGHLGQKEKFLLVLFQKKSDLARYSKSFCGRESQNSQYFRHFASGFYSVVMTADGEDGPRDCESTYAQFRFFVAQMLLDAAGGATPWLTYGLAHRYEREVPCNLINCGVRADESVDPATQYEWPKKIAKRCRHESLCMPFAKLCREHDLGYYGHLQSWARVDYLMQDRAKFAQFLQMIVGNPTRQRHLQALAEVYDKEPEQFDEEWRKWALKHY